MIQTDNDISRENALPGTPREYWDLASGSSSLIEGFTTNISVNHGETVDFKINSDAPYKIEIFRLGYYNGDGARLISTIGGLPASIQPDPLRDSESGLVDAGNWSVTARWTTPDDLTSGAFLAKITRLDGTGESHIPFIVRDDDSRSDILFQTSDTTWQAYNPWGSIDDDGRGASLYSGDAPPDRAYAVSYNRPITTRDLPEIGPLNNILGPEYSAIYWLEKNGYDVTYSSGQDTHLRGGQYS